VERNVVVSFGPIICPFGKQKESSETTQTLWGENRTGVSKIKLKDLDHRTVSSSRSVSCSAEYVINMYLNFNYKIINMVTIILGEPGYHSRYSDWLLAERPRGLSSSPGGVKNFYFLMSSRPALRFTQPPIQWVPGSLSLVVKRPRREADHLPPASVEAKKMWIYNQLPHTPSWRSA
jgi:hypothetical protein